MNKCSRSTARYPRLWLDLPSALPGSLGVAVARGGDLGPIREPRTTRRCNPHLGVFPIPLDLNAAQVLAVLARQLLTLQITVGLHPLELGIGLHLTYHLGGLTHG